MQEYNVTITVGNTELHGVYKATNYNRACELAQDRLWWVVRDQNPELSDAEVDTWCSRGTVQGGPVCHK